MKTIAITSTTGGAGRTTLAGALAVLLARRGRPVVAVEFDAQNLMGATLGLDTLAEHGLAHSLLADPADAAPWHAHTWRNADGVLFVPYGQVDAAGAAACDARLAAEPDWLSRALDEIALPAEGVVLVDTARYPSPQAEQAIRRADLTLVVVPPEPAACATVAARLDALGAGRGDLQIVVNRLNPARDMQRDNGGNVKTARHNRGVRRQAPQVGKERGKCMLLVLNHIRRTQVVSNQDTVTVPLGLSGHIAWVAQQNLQNPLDHLNHVSFPFSKIWILNLLELRHEHFHLLSNSPLSVTLVLGNVSFGRGGKRGIVQDHAMQIQKCAILGCCRTADYRRM